jgi:hypothetical protein
MRNDTKFIFIFFLSFIHGLRLSANLHFLSFFRTWVEAESYSSLVLLKAFSILVLGVQGLIFDSYEASSICVVWYWDWWYKRLVW